ncbi:MAG TPA: DUF1508 domain-containing protein [Rhodospirillaceae bacterium]|nr:DUF1508 domain-containing protein [Rhodospirillaceae bacterium]
MGQPTQTELQEWRSDVWDIYKDMQGMWRWRRTARNGKIVGASCEGYNNRLDCYNNARRHGYVGE